MTIDHSLFMALFICFAGGLSSAQQGQEIMIAAAADLQPAMNELVSAYKTQSRAQLKVTYGSSGNFFAQIQNGAPFDLFFSADVDHPRKLDLAGLAEPGTLYEYAVGQIVLWAPLGVHVELARQQWSALLDPSVQKIAVANPAHAPYGRAAIAALEKAGIYGRVQSKLVYGENISQAAQFVQSGNAQVGIVAKSLAVSPSMKSGQVWEIPPDMHPPIEQAAIVLKNGSNKAAARSFLDFVRSDHGRAILAKHGFEFETVPVAAGQDELKD